MHIKKKKVFISILLVLLFFILFKVSYKPLSKYQSKLKVDDVINLIEKDASEIDYNYLIKR
ncbi:hypothetical protein SAMN03080614_10632 [Anaerobranca gottschalkii DSM 13577]|uniref:Uncharacterized protein n=1 Tax=Anaerobranca gottschalkii DSM 13577 TaxID=1120990 RepID=A0A1I0C8V3_9FIRM|nr:hypothetical protein SAMN03080614_10632 [Anaerobranca gottschalkii DSM 13577]